MVGSAGRFVLSCCLVSIEIHLNSKAFFKKVKLILTLIGRLPTGIHPARELQRRGGDQMSNAGLIELFWRLPLK